MTIKVDFNPTTLIPNYILDQTTLNFAKQAIREFKAENPQQTKNPALTKEHIEGMKEHSWLKSCTTILYTHDEYLDQDDALNDLINDLLSEAETVQDEVNLKTPKPLVALDLETTGLNKTVKKIGGQNVIFNEIVGICVAASDTKGYYIPVRHNQLDKIENFDPEPITRFLQRLVDEFHLVFHNAIFDLEVMALSGKVRLNHATYSDTLLIATLSGYKEFYRQVGLKFLSEELLARPMVEINELMGSKNHIMLHTIPASSAYVYGCSDAMNTLGIFWAMMNDYNPYKDQKNAMRVDLKMTRHIRSMYRCGLPVNYELGLAYLKTLLRRMIMCENIFYSSVSDDSLEMTSAEQVGTHIFTLIKTEFEKQYNNSKPLKQTDKGFSLLCKRLQHDFGMEVKIKELKTGTKIAANSPALVLESLYNYLETWEFIPDDVADEIYIICETLDHYRSLTHEANIFFKLVRYCYNDDLDVCRTGINLKLNGADTSRFSNQSSRHGANDNVTIVELKTKTKATLNLGDGITGVNSQGLSNNSGHHDVWKRVDNYKDLDPQYKSVSDKMEALVEARLVDMFKTGKL